MWHDILLDINPYKNIDRGCEDAPTAIGIKSADGRDLLKAVTAKIDAAGVDMDAFLRFLDESLDSDPLIFNRAQPAREGQH